MQVTILTPTLNAERHLGECLLSIRHQSHPRHLVQHLVLDGGSSDGTVRMAREAGAEVHVERDGTLYAALNRGVAMASGEIVGWLNADDTFESGILARVAATFRASPRAEIVVGDWVMATPNRDVRMPACTDALLRIRQGRRGRKCWVAPLAVFFRTDVLRGLGEYSTRYRVAADLDLWVRAAARTPLPEVVHAGQVAGTFRVHEGSLSSGRSPEVPLKEVLDVASRWIADTAAPEGVRRFALYLLRRHRYELSRWESRDLPWPRRQAARFRCLRELSRLGPGALGDIRRAIW